MLRGLNQPDLVACCRLSRMATHTVLRPCHLLETAQLNQGMHVQTFHQTVEFDGLWLDMNEVSNYCTGDVCQVPSEHPP